MTSCKINRHVLRYIEMVENEEIRACEEQRLLVAMVRQCFETEDIYTDDEQAEKYLGLSRYFPYERVFEWQKFVLALHDCTYWRDTGMPRWPDLFCLIGRGAGKDGTIALEGMSLMSPYNGIRGYDIDVCANNEEQAMRPVEDLYEALEDPANRKKLLKHFYWNKEKIVGRKTRSTMRGRTNNPKGKDGLRSGIVIFNEIHQYENYANINVFTTGLGKKKHPRRSYYTTNGDVRGGVLDDLLETAEGILRNGEPDNGLLPFICKLNTREEVHDPQNWEMANPSLPYLPNLRLEIEKEYREWVKNPARLPAFMTKRMNLPETAQDTPVTEWPNILATDRPFPDLEGWSCTAGIDFTKITDWAAVDLHFRNGELRYDLNHAWVCTRSRDLPRIKAPWREWAQDGLVTAVDDVEIHPDLIVEHIRAAASRYDIPGVALDDFRYALLARALADIGFSAKDYKNVKLVRPNDIMRVAPVIDSVFVNQGFIWGNNPVLRWAANNTKLMPALKKEGQDVGNFKYGKIEGRSRKTDPFMALVHAMVIEGQLGDGGNLELPQLEAIVY